MATFSLKWLSGATAAVLSAMLLLPQWGQAAPEKIKLDDERMAASKQQALHRMKESEKHRKKLGLAPGGEKRMPRSGNVNGTNPDGTAVSKLTYSGKTSRYTVHHYQFNTTSPGVVKIRANHSSPVVDYLLIDGTSLVGDNWKIYRDGDLLPAGFYMFEIVSYSDVPVDYSFEIEGVPFDGTPDQTVPDLKIESPSVREGEMPLNQSGIRVKGTHDADEAGVYINGNGPTPLEPVFDKTIPVQYGWVTLHVAAFEQSGNYVIESYRLAMPGVKRIDGADRYEVSANISRNMYPDEFGGTVVIARGDLYTDALSGGALAGLEWAPILLTNPNSPTLPTPVLAEIDRIHPQKAILLGGPASVPETVRTQLESRGMDVERIGGANRFEVSAGIASKVMKFFDDYFPEYRPDTAIVASGLVFPDALSVSGVSGLFGLPILQVTKDTVPKEIDAWIKNRPDIRYFIIVGGPGTVSEQVEAKLASVAVSRGGMVDRISGANRYEVSVNAARYFGPWMDPSTHVIAKGTDFPDALSGGPLARNFFALMLLTSPNRLEPQVAEYLNRVESEFGVRKMGMFILGGTGSISTQVEQQLTDMLK
ncbi:cell wall-binding repeat-containing protein [Staphylospora marina]|uniref:cell wall-binding repeat-containing protein n=1 Tax=Staphylospora marina TaxID=2490858 RepID=UPI000F5BFE63|nr:cell wall-binding repeat-containing protein [Staphylospora marina]